MESPRQAAFKELRPVCVELSSVGLKFRGHQATSDDVLRALEPVYNILKECSKRDALDEKLAEYAFFPLTNIFNETQRVSARCLEVAVRCLTILVAQGWRQKLSTQMGKQLIILVTLIVGGPPTQKNGASARRDQPVELAEAGFECLEVIFGALQGSVAERTIFNEIGTATIVDQTVYILLEGVADETSDDTCIAAAKALQTLFLRVTDRLVLASIMPRTVSALTKVIRPTTQVRRSYRLLEICIDVLTQMLRSVLNDEVVTTPPQKATQSVESSERLVLDESWLNATVTQIKLALSNIVQIRRHERLEVQTALLRLCLMVLTECAKTLKEALPIMVETVVALSETSEATGSNEAYSKLKALAITDSNVVDLLRESLHTWTTSFPRVMQNNDETAKQRAVRQVSTAFQILSEVGPASDILTANLASGLCDSVAAAVNPLSTDTQLWDMSRGGNFDFSLTETKSGSTMFPSVLLDTRSQQRTLQDLQSLITRLSLSDSGEAITRSMINRLHNTTGTSIISPFWLVLNFLRANAAGSEGFDDFISLEQVDSSEISTRRADMIEELYYFSLPMLSDGAESRDWRALALALEAVALQAQQLGKAFRPELMDALYPTLQLLASGHGQLQRHAMTCLNVLTTACSYPDISSMIIDNVDYLTNSVSLRLNMFDVSPYPSQILLMMVRLCGAKLIPYLDDLVDSLFGIVDMYHGYPRLVEVMFSTLSAIVEEGTKNPSLLAITDGKNVLDPLKHRKRPYRSLAMSTVVEDFASWKSKRVRFSDEQVEDSSEDFSHPRKPWVDEADDKERRPEDGPLSDMLEKDDSDEPLPPPREPDDTEKPLSKSHNLLLHIVKAIPSHLSSPSPYLRRSLLSILARVIPTLSLNDNSFLPLINELWPAVAARITFPAFTQEDSSTRAILGQDAPTSTSLAKRAAPDSDSTNFQEETFVIVAACQAVQAMCEGAGDFMASRVEAEFPRWERLYRKVWEKVRVDADRAIERRAQQRSKGSSSVRTGQVGPDAAGHATTRESITAQSADFLPALSLSIPSPSSLVTGIGATVEPPSSFTPHHTLWRALTLLFITLLTNVRLPLATGDQICEFLTAWIVRYAGPEYYFSDHRRRRLQQQHQPEPSNTSQAASIKAVEDATQAMDTWNADLQWFLFQQQRQIRNNNGRSEPKDQISRNERRQEQMTEGDACPGSTSTSASTSSTVKGTGLLHEHVRFAEVVF